jgi:hypothetical protein
MIVRRLAATIAMATCLSGCPASDDGTALLRNETGRDLRIFVKDAAGRPFRDAALDPVFTFDTQFPDRERQCLVDGDGSFEVRDANGTVLVEHDFADRAVCEHDELELTVGGDLVWLEAH